MVRVLSPEEIDRDYSQLLDVPLLVGLFGLLDGDVEMAFYLLLGLSPVVMKGYDFRQVGVNDGHAGVLHEFSRFSRAYPPNVWSKGEILLTPRAPRCHSPQQPVRKKKKLCVLGMGCGHLTSAS